MRAKKHAGLVGGHMLRSQTRCIGGLSRKIHSRQRHVGFVRRDHEAMAQDLRRCQLSRQSIAAEVSRVVAPVADPPP